jgi:crossover junction endodeoxyribonuclease RuvC
LLTPMILMQHCVVRDVGVIRANKSHPAITRIRDIYSSASSLFAEFLPHVCVLENVFLGKNVRSALMLGQARSAFICASAKHGTEIAEIASTAAKRCITGNGHATKEHVRDALKLQLGWHNQNVPLDATDALAIALAHALSLSGKDLHRSHGALPANAHAL